VALVESAGDLSVVGTGGPGSTRSLSRRRTSPTSCSWTGASGYLLKAAPEAELLAGIRAVAAGEVALAPSVSRVLVCQAAKPAPAITQIGG